MLPADAEDVRGESLPIRGERSASRARAQRAGECVRGWESSTHHLKEPPQLETARIRDALDHREGMYGSNDAGGGEAKTGALATRKGPQVGSRILNAASAAGGKDEDVVVFDDDEGAWGGSVSVRKRSITDVPGRVCSHGGHAEGSNRRGTTASCGDASNGLRYGTSRRVVLRLRRDGLAGANTDGVFVHTAAAGSM